MGARAAWDDRALEALARRTQLLLLLREEFEDDAELDEVVDGLQAIVQQRIARHLVGMAREQMGEGAQPEAAPATAHDWEELRCRRCGMERTKATEAQGCAA